MLKFLRWLLVPLLPLVGLVTGFMLMPEIKSSWQRSSSEDPFKVDDAIAVLGHVKKGATLLVAELTLQETQPSLIGIDVSSGKEQFRYVLTNDLLPARDPLILDAILCEDGNHVFFVVKPDLYSGYRQVVMFDWNTRQLGKRFSLNTKDFITSIHQSGNHLAAKTNDGLTFWSLDQPDAPTNIPFHGDATSDASVVFGKQYRFSNNWTGGIKGILPVLELYDIKKRIPLKPIQADLTIVNWSSDSQSFNAILDDSSTQSLVSRQFIRVNDEFRSVLDKDLVFNMKGTVVIDQHFLAIISSVKKGSWRRKIDDILGSSVSSWLDRIWPDAQTVSLFDRTNTRLLHKLILPIDHKDLSNLKINCHPQGHSIALWNNKSITYWELYPFSRHYPLLGLVAGLILATLLAWKLLRHQPRIASTLTPKATD